MNRLWGVLLGIFVDVLGSTLVGIVITFVLLVSFLLRGVPVDGLTSQLETHARRLPIQLIGILYGGAMSVLAGYLTARIAREQIYRCAGIVAAVSATLGYLAGTRSHATHVNLLLAVLTTASVLTGALIWSKSTRGKAL